MMEEEEERQMPESIQINSSPIEQEEISSELGNKVEKITSLLNGHLLK